MSHLSGACKSPSRHLSGPCSNSTYIYTYTYIYIYIQGLIRLFIMPLKGHLVLRLDKGDSDTAAHALFMEKLQKQLAEQKQIILQQGEQGPYKALKVLVRPLMAS